MIWSKPPGNYVPAVNLQGCNPKWPTNSGFQDLSKLPRGSSSCKIILFSTVSGWQSWLVYKSFGIVGPLPMAWKMADKWGGFLPTLQSGMLLQVGTSSNRHRWLLLNPNSPPQRGGPGAVSAAKMRAVQLEEKELFWCLSARFTGDSW